MSEMHPFGSGSYAPLENPNEMPECYPIKGNTDSMKYHRPDSTSYGATVAEVWFAAPSIAEAAGFSLSGSHPNDVSSADFEPGQAGHPCTAADLTEMGVSAVAHPYGPGSHVPLRDPREMPECYIIKGNADSMLYHRPDSANYGATVAEVWFISPSVADAAGFSLSNTHPTNSSSADFEPGGSGNPCTASRLRELGLGAVAQPYGAGSHAPLDDPREMPACYVIKGNVDSMLYHRPDSANYDATVAEVWFVSPSVAQAAGFSLSSTHPNDSSSADFEPGAPGHTCSASDLMAIGLSALVHPFGPSSRAPLGNVREMPECYPIKGNVDSMLYHRPDSANYGATVAEVWFVSPSSAEAAGFSLSTTHPKGSSSADFELGSSGHPCSAVQFGDLVAAGVSAVAASGVAGSAGSAIGGGSERGSAAAAQTLTGGAASGAAVASGVSSASDSDSAAKPVASDDGDEDSGSSIGKAVAGAAAGAVVAGVARIAGAFGDDDETMDAAAAANAAEKAAAAKAEADRATAAKVAADRVAAEKAEAEKAASEKAAAEKAAAAKAEADRAAADKVAAEKAAADRAAAEKAASDRAAAEKAAAEKAAADKVAADKVAADKVAADKVAADKVAAAASLGDDDTVAGKDAAAVRETVQMAAADGDLPFGVGSHAPFADVHEMPACHPIKGNADSMKYHRPDSQGYPKTKAEVWFVSPSVAEAAGFSLAGSHPEGTSSADFEPGGSGHPCTAEQVAGLGLPGGAAAVAGIAAAGVGGAAGVAASDAATTDTVEISTAASGAASIDDTVRIPAASSTDAQLQPYGLGSRAPLADVHEVPACYPIKGNADSMKYHRPDSQGYQQTKAEVWFVSPSVAEAAGFALAGSHPDGSSSADFEPGGSGHPCTADQLADMGLGALGFAAGAGVLAGAAAGGIADGAASADEADEDRGIGKTAAMAAAVAGVAAVAGAASLLGRDDDDDDSTEDLSTDETISADQAASQRASAAVAGARDTIGDDDMTADGISDDDTSEGLGKGVVATGAAGAAALGAAALLGGDDDTTAAAAAPVVDPRETIRTNVAGVRDTIDEETTGARGKGAAAAAGVAGLAGAAALAGDGIDDGKAAAAAGAAADKGKAMAGGAAGKVAAGAGAVGAGAAGAAGASRLGGVGGGGGDDDDRGVAGAGRFGWLKWLLPLLLLALLIALLLALCGGSDGDGVATAPDPTAVVDPTPEPEPEPTVEPAAEPTVEPAAEPVADPTPEPAAEPAPDPTATPEPEPTPEPAASCAALVPTLEENGFTTVLALLSVAELGDELSDSGPLTLFAPTNEAFDALPALIASTVQSNVRLLDQVLRYHVVPGAVMAGDLVPSSLETLSGSSLAIRTNGTAPTANAAGISPVDLPADACVIHGVDSLLIPPSLLTSLGIASLNDAVGGEAISFVDGTADFTDADSATLQAICNMVATEESTNGLPAVQWQASGDDDLDGQRAAAIEEVLASCGPGGIVLDQQATQPSFTG